MTEPRGIRAYDLTLPTANPFTGDWQPLRNSPSAAEQNAARHEAANREARIRQAAEEALAEWQEFADALAGNPVAIAALRCHRPEAEYGRVVCGECKESDLDDTVGAEWPCGTYMQMKASG